MDNEQEKALMASIEHKMENVLQSVRSRTSMASSDTPQWRTSAGSGSADLTSPTTPQALTSSDTSDTATTLPDKPTIDPTPEKSVDMQLSADNFDETFSEETDSDPQLDTGMPVDSLVNFVAPAEIQHKGSARKKERGHITEQGATQDNEDTPIRKKSRGRVIKGNSAKSPDTSGKVTSMAGKFLKKITNGLRSVGSASKNQNGPAEHS